VHRDPREARLIREAVANVLEGVPLRAIARDWNADGIQTSRGTDWNHTTLRRLLKRHRLVGIQVRHGEVLRDAVGEPVRGNWEPILDADTFDRLQAALERDSRGGARRGARRYLLTGTLRCGICGARMHGMVMNKGSHGYTCQQEGSGHTLTIQGPRTDELATDLVRARLAQESLEAPAPEPAPGAERLAQIPGLMAELMDAFRAGQLPGSVVFPQIEQLEAERAELQAQRNAQVQAASYPQAVGVGNFDALDLDRQRAVLETLLDAIVVAPAKYRGEPWSTDRLTISWKA